MEAKASERGSDATTHLGVHTLGYFWLLLEVSAGNRCNAVVP